MGAPTEPKDDAETPQPETNAFYEGLLDEGEPQNPPGQWYGEQYGQAPMGHFVPDYGYGYGGSPYGMGPQFNPYANPYDHGRILSVVDLQNMGADLSLICVEFAANQQCPRGPSCRFYHCKV